MKYNVTLIDPASYKYGYLATDQCRAIAFGLRSLGHTCNLTTNNLDSSSINIVIAGHLLTEADSQAIVNAGLKYIVHQSEVLSIAPDGKVISSFLGDQFEARCRRLFENALLIWEPAPDNQQAIRTLGIPPERIRTFRIGFHEAMYNVQHRSWAEKDIDVFFMGSTTTRRNIILNELRKSLNVVALLDAPAAFRNDFIARAKINIGLRATDGFTHLEALRVTTLLNNRCTALIETADTHPELQALVDTAPYDQLVARCQEMLAEGPVALDAKAERGFQGFRQMPMTEVLQELL